MITVVNYWVVEHIFGADTRKGTTVNYVAHLLGVRALVLADGGSEDEAIAALLHDTLEDKSPPVTPEGLTERFGPQVTRIVQACTDTEPGYAGGPRGRGARARRSTSAT